MGEDLRGECERKRKNVWGRGRGKTRSTKEYKGRTYSNSPTGPNEAVRVAALYYYCNYMLRQKDSKGEDSSPPIPPSIKSWPEKGSETM